MKIAIPTVNDKLCMHFGHCEVFTFVDVDPTKKCIVSTETLTPPPHEPGILPPWIAEHEAKIVIAGGMGGRARQLFEAQGITVIVGAQSKAPEELVNDFLNNTLELGQNACDH